MALTYEGETRRKIGRQTDGVRYKASKGESQYTEFKLTTS